VVCQDTHWSPNAERADVVLPAATFAEAGGTWVNTEGRVRTYAPAVAAAADVRTDGDLLASLAERLGRPDLAPGDRAAVLRTIRGLVPALGGHDPSTQPEDGALLPGGPAGRAGFVPVAAPRPRRGRRPAAGPGIVKEALRGFDLVAGSRGYARLRRTR
jgi:hypothetical protein